MATCRIDTDASPQFALSCESWQKCGYSTVKSDVQDALAKIRKDHLACRCRPVPRFAAVLGDFQLLKYRQKNAGASEGARGGWRILALYHKQDGILYPILVYPKKEWADAPDKQVTGYIQELLDSLREPRLNL